MCEQPEILCRHCGSIVCRGDCGNSKLCVSCAIIALNLATFEAEERLGLTFEDAMRSSAQEVCAKAKCRCECHSGNFCAPPLSSVGASSLLDSGFPFLKLSPEIRNLIYRELLLPVGDKRSSPFYVGKVHLPILETCQQVYQEACNIPLSGNTLWFESQVQAHIFFYRFRELVDLSRITSMHLDLDQEDISCPFFPFLCADHASFLPSLVHLVITVKGKIEERHLSENSGLIKGLEEFEGLKSFELELPYFGLRQSIKDEAVERFKKRLLTKAVETPADDSPQTPESKESKLEEGLGGVEVPGNNNHNKE